VEQTLAFAAKTRAPHQRIGNRTRREFVTDVTHVLTTIFGLKHALKTPVGDAAIRGVSGGDSFLSLIRLTKAKLKKYR
jgi:ATP-binding cassette subfamily G (WHITE) protein 2 (SNQ2)